MSSKAELRRRMRSLLKANASGLTHRSESVCEQIQRQPEWNAIKTVGLYCPLAEEPDVLPLLSNKHRRCVFPRIAGEKLVWHAVFDAGDLQFGPDRTAWRVREPMHGDEVPLSEVECLIVPGLAFTKEGARLGRGGGYYDRTLAELGAGCLTFGVCFEFQILEEIPMEEHDLRVQRVFWG